MVFRDVQGGEVVEIGLDLRTVRHLEADRRKQRLDPGHCAGDRMQAGDGITASRQGHVQRLRRQLPVQFGGLNGIAARAQEGFDLILGLIDAGTSGLALLGGQRAQALHLLSDDAALAQVTGLDLVENGQAAGGGELLFGILENFVEIHARTHCS